MSARSPSADDAIPAFEALFVAHYDDLLRYAARRVGRDLAADVVAEVFLVAWRRRGDYEQSTARLWLFGVARRVVANQERAQLRAARLAAKVGRDRSESLASAETGDPASSHERVRAVVSALPPAEREALRLIAWDGFEIAEAARITGCSTATLRVRLHRARRRVARELADRLDAPTEEEPAHERSR